MTSKTIALQHAARRGFAAGADHESWPRLSPGRRPTRTKTQDYYFVADAKKADGSHVFAVTPERARGEQGPRSAPVTRRAGIIGHPVAHSLSPVFQDAASRRRA